LREREFLKERYGAIFCNTGMILSLVGLLMFLPLLTILAYPRESMHFWAFAAPGGILALFGLCLWRFLRSSLSSPLTTGDGGVIVLVSWVVAVLFSAWPFSAILNLEFSRAVFEAVSGWTTTGLSVVDVQSAGPMILLWRSVMQLAGGAGLAIIMISSIVGAPGVGLSSAEGRSDQLVPHVLQSARLVLAIYSGYALAGIVAYKLAGMSVFDAVNHSFAAVSTGGFSTRVESIGHWDSTAVEAVTIPLMLLGNLSFVTAWFLLQGNFRSTWRNGEVRLMMVVIPLSTAALFLLTSSALYPLMGKSLRVSVFETVTALTTTGFSTVSYEKWDPFGIIVLIVLMLIGGGTCSTAGGIKQFRIYALWKLTIWELRRQVLPKTTVMTRSMWEGDRKVFLEDARARQIGVFLFVYLAAFLAGTAVLCACGYSIRDSLFEFASAIGTVGLSIGVTSAHMHDAALWAETVAMFLGRLEFMVILVSLWRLAKDARLFISW